MPGTEGGGGPGGLGPDWAPVTRGEPHPVDRILDVLLGEASRLVRWRVKNHLRGCAACRREWDRLSLDVEFLGGADRSLGMHAGPAGAAWPSVADRARSDLLERVRRATVRRHLWQQTRFGVGMVFGAGALFLVLQTSGVGIGVVPGPAPSRPAEPAAGWKPTEVASLTSAGAPAKGAVYFDAPARRVTLEVRDLPRLPVGDVYEVWWVTGTGREPAGTFSVDRRGDAVSTVSLPTVPVRVRAVGITREPMPGTREPTTRRVVGGVVKPGSFRGIAGLHGKRTGTSRP